MLLTLLILLIIILNLFKPFRFFLGNHYININSEYGWKRFRSSELKDAKWLFSDINHYVTSYLKNKKFKEGAEFRREFAQDQEFFKLLAKLQEMVKEDYIPEDVIIKFSLEGWRTQWLNGFIQNLSAQTKKTILDTKFNFANFYFEDKYENFYDTYILSHVFFQAVLLYGTNRNLFIKLANANEAEMLPIPQFYNFNFIKSHSFFSKWKNFLYELDESVFFFKLPRWCFHKELFNYQIVNTKEIYAFSEKEEVLDQENEDDIKFFLVDNPSYWFNFIMAWLFVIPIYFFYKFTFVVLWPKGYIIVKHEIEFYLYGFLGRFIFLNDFFDSIISAHWVDSRGNRRKASSQSSPHRKHYRRRYRIRLDYLLENTCWGNLGFVKVRKKKIFYFFKQIIFAWRNFLNIFIYIFILFLFITYRYKQLKKYIFVSQYMSFFKFKFLKLFWKIRLYMNIKNNIKKILFEKKC